MDKVALVELLRSRLDGVLAVYAFGSRVQGTADEGSDLDLAVLVKGEHWWVAEGPEAGLFECAVLSEKLELDRARAPLLWDIERDGRVYGR